VRRVGKPRVCYPVRSLLSYDVICGDRRTARYIEDEPIEDEPIEDHFDSIFHVLIPNTTARRYSEMNMPIGFEPRKLSSQNKTRTKRHEDLYFMFLSNVQGS